MIHGPDVSVYQGNPDWRKVKAAGCDFAFVKATEGLSYVNPTFARQWPEMKAAGIIRGAYHFGRPSGDARAQARTFLNVVGGYVKGDLPPVLDIEVSDGTTPATVKKWVETFVAEVVKIAGVKPIIYTGGPFWRANIGATNSFGCPLWLAAYVHDPKPYIPGGWKNYTFWQYTSTASVSGIEGKCDMSVFRGDRNALVALCGHKPVSAKTRGRWRSNVLVLNRILKAHPEWPESMKKGLRWSRDRYRRALAKP